MPPGIIRPLPTVWPSGAGRATRFRRYLDCEHHFAGEVVYGDALVFGAAVAVKTQRVLLGLGWWRWPYTNPVQLAIQTALLDNLSRGRLIVGTGRGSNYNAYEYVGSAPAWTRASNAP